MEGENGVLTLGSSIAELCECSVEQPWLLLIPRLLLIALVLQTCTVSETAPLQRQHESPRPAAASVFIQQFSIQQAPRLPGTSCPHP